MGGILAPMQNGLPYVVAHAPLAESVGAIVSDSATYNKLTRNGAVLLPIEPKLETELTMGGFVRRSWGPDGIRFGANRGQGGSSLMLQVRTGVPFVHWAAGIVKRGASPQGQLRLAAETSSAQSLQCGLTVLQTPPHFDLNKIEDNRLVLTGYSRINTLLDGFLGLQLWGVCQDVGVLWIAVSQSSSPE